MGALVTKALRPIKSFNIENRAHRVISKEKPVAAPMYPSTLEELKRAQEIVPELETKLDRKDPALDERLKDVYVTSYGRPEDDVTKEIRDKKSSDKPLPQNRVSPRKGSVGAASLGARRDAPAERRAPSVRSDERPLATQGDMLNSIKIQRRLRDTLNIERHGNKLSDKNSTTSKEKANVRHINSRTSNSGLKPVVNNFDQRDKTVANITRAFNNRPRPSSPKGRRSPHPPFY